MQGVENISNNSDRLLTQIARTMVEIGNQTDFGALETELLIAMTKMIMKQHIRQHHVGEIEYVLRQFVDKLETELACRAKELSNYQVASICHEHTEYL